MTTVFDSSAQNTFKELADKMLFNIFHTQSSSVVHDFVEKYFPTYVNVKDTANWAISSRNEDYVEPQKTVHTIFFTKHPFFDFKFSEGKFEVYSQETKSLLPRIWQVHLWFFFDSKESVEKALNDILIKFEPVCKSRKDIGKGEKRVILLSDQEKMDSLNCIQLIILKDDVHENKYKILFTNGAFTYDNNFYNFD